MLKQDDKKEYIFGEIEICTFEQILNELSSPLEIYEIYAYIPLSARCDGRNSPVDPC
jgi:hypothetical protein